MDGDPISWVNAMGSDPQDILEHDYQNCSCFKAKVLDEFTRILDEEIHTLNELLIVDHGGKDGEGISYVDKMMVLEQEKRTLNTIKEKIR